MLQGYTLPRTATGRSSVVAPPPWHYSGEIVAVDFTVRVDAVAATGDSATTGAVGPVAVPAWATLLTLNAPGGVTTPDSQPMLRWTSPAIAASEETDVATAVAEVPKVGRNDPCPCGSGKKYKKCCLGK